MLSRPSSAASSAAPAPKKPAAASSATKPTASSSAKKPVVAEYKANRDAHQRILVERGEIERLQSERRTLAARLAEADVSVAALRETESGLRDRLEAAKADAATQQEVTARGEALLREDRDRADAAALAADGRAREANEARAAAQAEQGRIGKELAVAHAAAARSADEARAVAAKLAAAEAEARRAAEVGALGEATLREELRSARERAAAAEGRLRDLEPERDGLNIERAALGERLSVALADRRGLEEQLRGAEETTRLAFEERDAARALVERAEGHARQAASDREAALAERAADHERIAQLEAELRGAAQVAASAGARLTAETAALAAHRSFAEERCRDVEAQRDNVSALRETERAERLKLESAVRRLEEELVAERVRAADAEERCLPLRRQRDEALREKRNALAALSAAMVEKREAEWRVSDLRWEPRGRTVAPSMASQPRAGDGGGRAAGVGEWPPSERPVSAEWTPRTQTARDALAGPAPPLGAVSGSIRADDGWHGFPGPEWPSASPLALSAAPAADGAAHRSRPVPALAFS